MSDSFKNPLYKCRDLRSRNFLDREYLVVFNWMILTSGEFVWKREKRHVAAVENLKIAVKSVSDSEFI